VTGQREILGRVGECNRFPVEDGAERAARLDEQVPVPEVAVPDGGLVVP
jgi:hypothetical protein